MRIRSPFAPGAALGLALALCSPAWPQESVPAAPAPETAFAGDAVPEPFADDTTIEQRLREIVELAKQASEDHHEYDLRTLTCGEFLTLAASDDPNDYAVMAMLMVWAHGYHSGLRGLDFQAYPLDTAGIVSLTTQMVGACREHPKELFHVAAARLD